jgi:hypothetical protein
MPKLETRRVGVVDTLAGKIGVPFVDMSATDDGAGAPAG